MYTLNIFKVDIKCYNRTGGSSNQSALPHMFSGAETRPGASFFFSSSLKSSVWGDFSHIWMRHLAHRQHILALCVVVRLHWILEMSALCVLHCYTCYLTYFVQRQGGKKRHPVRTLTFLDKSLKCNSYSAVDQEASSQTFRYFELIRHFSLKFSPPGQYFTSTVLLSGCVLLIFYFRYFCLALPTF